MTFDATKTNFRNAEIIGSKAQQEDNLLSNRLNEIGREMEKLKNSVDDTMTELEMDSIKKKYNSLKEKEIITNQNFVKEFPNSLVSSHILNVYATTWGKEKTKELFNQISIKNKESEYGLEIQQYIRLNKNPKIGEQFVDFEMPNENSQSKKLSNFKGKIVLLEFWASWCGPCRKENPNLVKTYKKFNPKGFEIFAVSIDEYKASWLKAIKKDSLNWEHVSDLKGRKNEASLIYGINGIPDNFLIAENGEIIGRNLRGEKLNEKLKDILE